MRLSICTALVLAATAAARIFICDSSRAECQIDGIISYRPSLSSIIEKNKIQSENQEEKLIFYPIARYGWYTGDDATFKDTLEIRVNMPNINWESIESNQAPPVDIYGNQITTAERNSRSLVAGWRARELYMNSLKTDFVEDCVYYNTGENTGEEETMRKSPPSEVSFSEYGTSFQVWVGGFARLESNVEAMYQCLKDSIGKTLRGIEFDWEEALLRLSPSQDFGVVKPSPLPLPLKGPTASQDLGEDNPPPLPAPSEGSRTSQDLGEDNPPPLPARPTESAASQDFGEDNPPPLPARPTESAASQDLGEDNPPPLPARPTESAASQDLGEGNPPPLPARPTT